MGLVFNYLKKKERRKPSPHHKVLVYLKKKKKDIKHLTSLGKLNLETSQILPRRQYRNDAHQQPQRWTEPWVTVGRDISIFN